MTTRLGARVGFDLQYLLGRAPWDTEVTPPEVMALLEDENWPPGRILDLGCGTGTTAIAMARRGWEAVGVDFSPLAIRRARRKARRVGVDCRFYQADVTDLTFLVERFDLALDIGCLHSVPVEGWVLYAAELARLVRMGGLYLLYAFTPRKQSAARGIAAAEVRRLFEPAFSVVRQKDGKDPNGPQSAWYWLRRGT
jgi:ubiquinone/menaquinone biosynthesis C-methylase UbiE